MFPVELVRQIQNAYCAGYRKCLEEHGQMRPYMTLREAHTRYGRGTVDRWIKEGLVKSIKDGEHSSRRRISREQIELVAETANRASWYQNKYENNTK